jgi:hypothetical protein
VILRNWVTGAPFSVDRNVRLHPSPLRDVVGLVVPLLDRGSRGSISVIVCWS